MTAAPDIDVVIVTYNSRATLPDAVRSIRRSPLVRWVVVVDNCSGDDSAAVARECGADEVLQNRCNLGFAAGVNLGIDRCQARFVLLLNPDAAVPPASLLALRRVLLENPKCALVGPVLLSGRDLVLGARRFSRPWQRIIRTYPLLRRVFASIPGEEYGARRKWLANAQPRQVDYVWGAACLVRRSFLSKVGGLDERYFMYCEDEDLGRSARAMGYTVLHAPGAIVPHIGGVSSAADPSAAEAWLMISLYRVFLKWNGERSASNYLRLVRLGYSCRVVAARLRGRRALALHAANVLRHTSGVAQGPVGMTSCTERVVDRKAGGAEDEGIPSAQAPL